MSGVEHDAPRPADEAKLMELTPIQRRLRDRMNRVIDAMVSQAFRFEEPPTVQKHPRLFWAFSRLSEATFRFGRALRSAWRAFRSEWNSEEENDSDY